MPDRLNDFAKALRDAPTDARAEKIVRYTVEEIAKDCPMRILVAIGQCIVDCRKSELQDEAERN
jgi:hypothetical protein